MRSPASPPKWTIQHLLDDGWEFYDEWLMPEGVGEYWSRYATHDGHQRLVTVAMVTGEAVVEVLRQDSIRFIPEPPRAT